MEKLKKATVLAAALSVLLIVAFGFVAPAAAAGCGERCKFQTGLCVPWGSTNGGCGDAGSYCYDIQCWGGSLAISADQVQKIAAAAEAGDMELAQKLAAGFPSLRIMKPGQMVFDGPQLAGMTFEQTLGGVGVACAGAPAEAPATPAEAPAEAAAAAADKE
jgi:hypothetical protein